MLGPNDEEVSADPPLTLRDLDERIHEFSKQRGWTKSHSPRNLLLAMIAEVGELSEIFQWRGEVRPGLPELTEQERVHVGEEMSDVLIYLMQMSRCCGIDLNAAVQDKMRKNNLKYPAPGKKRDESQE
ncbi:hypothetical protein BC830DRAFT_1096529 [Chytriomyces sp. MP71]|nr:hypothetical protein BC830DRAFT_1096529 [Chytriomyces sp. MP71]